MNKEKTNRIYITVIHIFVAMFLAYLSCMVLLKKQLPYAVGIILGVLALTVLIAHIYFYFNSKETYNYTSKPKYECNCGTSDAQEKMLARGFHVDPNDSDYDTIGGVGGVGWVQ